MQASPAYLRAMDHLSEGMRQAGLPSDRVIMLHVSLRGLHEHTGLDYASCARLVLDAVGTFSPRAVLVPTFTYTFSKSRVFHRLFSRSEPGRFSEEARLAHARHRTPDPMFSVVDTTDWLQGQTGLRFDGAFESGCIWERLLKEDCAIVNVGIESFVATQIHYVERLAEVPWRSHVFMPGVVYDDETRFRHVDYDFFARDLGQNRLLNWPRIRAVLEEEGVLATGHGPGADVAWVGCRQFHDVLASRMAKDPYFPVRPVGGEA